MWFGLGVLFLFAGWRDLLSLGLAIGILDNMIDLSVYYLSVLMSILLLYCWFYYIYNSLVYDKGNNFFKFEEA